MLDKNDKVIRQSKAATRKLQKEFVKGWLEDHQDDFADVMEELRTRDLRLYAKLSIDMMKLVMPKEQNTNIRVGLERDFAELMMMAKTSSRQITTVDGIGESVEALPEEAPGEFVRFEDCSEPPMSLPAIERLGTPEELMRTDD